MSDATGWLTVRRCLADIVARSSMEDAALLTAVAGTLDAAEAMNNHLTDKEWSIALGPMSYDGRRPSVTESLRHRLDVKLVELIGSAKAYFGEQK